MLRAYPYESTVDAGGQLLLNVSTDAPSYSVRVERWTDDPQTVLEAGPFPGEAAAPGAAGEPWRWPQIALRVPRDAPPGAYLARLLPRGGADERGAPADHTPDARWGTALFVVRGASSARVLVNLPIFTYHAYNVAGVDPLRNEDPGSCLYTGAAAVTLRRPGGGTGGHPWDEATVDAYDVTSPRHTFAHWDMPALRWFAREGIETDVCTDLDLHHGAVDLRRYGMVCMFGHDEYWTREKRAVIETWVDGGGNVAYFGGNTCWGRVRYDETTASISRDGKWEDQPEDALTGLGWRNGGGKWVGLRPPTGYTIERDDDPIMRDAGISAGDVVGAERALVGYEFDGIDPGHAPRGIVVLGRADPTAWDVPEGTGRLWPRCNAAMVRFARGRGEVFNAGTTDWARVLAQGDEDVVAITRSVVRRLSA
jgi:hypothetical protein